MNGILSILVGGLTGCLTGKLMGEKGYGEILKEGYTKSLDIVFGMVGASVGGYLFFWAIIGGDSSFSRYSTAVLGSITLVGFVRQVSGKNLPFRIL